MHQTSSGQRLIAALRQLEQFSGAVGAADNQAIDCLSGARITSYAGEHAESELLLVRVPGGEPFSVNGRNYLELQVTVSARLEIDSGKSEGKVATRARQLLDQLIGKFAL